MAAARPVVPAALIEVMDVIDKGAVGVDRPIEVAVLLEGKKVVDALIVAFDMPVVVVVALAVFAFDSEVVLSDGTEQ